MNLHDRSASDLVLKREYHLRLVELNKRMQSAGVTTYLEVVTAQSTALVNERAAVDVLTRRMTASVNLVKALGGGWTTSDLPPGAGLVPDGASSTAKRDTATPAPIQPAAPNASDLTPHR